MPGVLRPYTLTDVLGAINDQAGANQLPGVTQIGGLGDFAEADETLPNTVIADSATTTVATNPAWDAGTWGTFVWA